MAVALDPTQALRTTISRARDRLLDPGPCKTIAACNIRIAKGETAAICAAVLPKNRVVPDLDTERLLRIDRYRPGPDKAPPAIHTIRSGFIPGAVCPICPVLAHSNEYEPQRSDSRRCRPGSALGDHRPLLE